MNRGAQQSLLLGCLLGWMLLPPRDLRAELVIQPTFAISKDPLTTEQIWKLDPGLIDPHRQLWVLDRKVELRSLKPQPIVKKIKNGAADSQNHPLFFLIAELLHSDVTLHLRSTKAFACTTLTPNETQKRGEQAAQIWQKQLASAQNKLEKKLRDLRAPNAEAARVRGYQIFYTWLQEQETVWRKKIHSLTVAPPGALPWTSCMDPVPADSTKIYPILHSRTPTRRWGDYFSIRVGLDIGGAKLLGQFLIDPKQAKSTISPEWLSSQGVKPQLLQLRDEPIPTVAVFAADVAGAIIPLRRFQLKLSERFSPPEFRSLCCDGILGRDFLRLYATEIQITRPPALVLWQREKYRAPTPYIWQEITEASLPLFSTQETTILDIAHGRYWTAYRPDTLNTVTRTAPFSLRYRFDNQGDRELVIESIVANSDAGRALKANGAKPGQRIESINGASASVLDEWQVRATVAGADGPQMTIGFKRKVITLSLAPSLRPMLPDPTQTVKN